MNEKDIRPKDAIDFDYKASVALRDIYKNRADVVWLDLESTVVDFEWWIHAADQRGGRAEVAAITDHAMNTGADFLQAVNIRRELTKPNRQTVYQANRQMPSTIEPGVVTFLQTLSKHDIFFRIVSGGFMETAELTQDVLGIPVEANRFAYDIGDPNRIAGVRDESPLARSQGKREHILLNRKNGLVDKRLVMIGDGMSDAETYPGAADLFIGYGGVAYRENVRKKSPLYVGDYSAALVVCLGEQNWRSTLNGSDLLARQMLLNGAEMIMKRRGVYFANDLDWQDLSARLQHCINIV